MKITPIHPAQNPLITDGVYDAVVESVTTGECNDGTRTYVKILLWLPGAKKYLVTNVYFDHERAYQPSAGRLWRFCWAVGLEMADVCEYPEEFQGLPLQIEVERADPAYSGQKDEYSDVRLFLPAGTAASCVREEEDGGENEMSFLTWL